MCMVDGTCTKGYPKQFSETTTDNVNGYPSYHRRDDGRTIVIGQKEVDNRWIVPFNRWIVPCVHGRWNLYQGYPKQFSETTIDNVNGYPSYHRRDDGRTIVIGQKEVDNRWIVPFNPWLSRKFDAHINVEICSSVKSVKYLFKCVYTRDMIVVTLRSELPVMDNSKMLQTLTK